MKDPLNPFRPAPAGRDRFKTVSESGAGIIKRIENFSSAYVQSRNIDVFLPYNYHPSKAYAVLYMHDGQMLFDGAATWNKQEWNADDTIARLMKEEKIKDTIVVGIWNNGTYRHAEYFPQESLAHLPSVVREQVISQLLMGRPQADNYLSFIVQELKPFIDSTFSTAADRANTFVAGSSMGALISMYAVCRYPKVFAGAACLSTHWPGYTLLKNSAIPDAFATYLTLNLPPSKDHKIYFDHGTEALDSLYQPHQSKVDNIMKLKGYNSSNWITKAFQGHDHSEASWSRRFHVPLQFLLAKENVRDNMAGNFASVAYNEAR